MDKRAAAFARLFEAVHEGVYIGTIGPDATATIAAMIAYSTIDCAARGAPRLSQPRAVRAPAIPVRASSCDCR